MNERFEAVHFVGIGGVGMSAIAELLLRAGHRISGSDLKDGPLLDHLRALGARVHIGHDATQVDGADVVVHSSAIRPDNPELRRARSLSVPVVARAEMLAELMRGRIGIAVAGSHGKTTTSSLITHVLRETGRSPSAVIGGRLLGASATRGGAVHGTSALLVAEADESDGSFLFLQPVICVITNIDPEHLDHYGSFESVQQAFVEFANHTPFWGLGVLGVDHPGVQAIQGKLRGRVATYGLRADVGEVEWRATDVRVGARGSHFEVQHEGRPLGEVALPLPGEHNVSNALAALAVAYELDVPFAEAAAALASFGGVARRFEAIGEVNGVRVIDDYAHHPAEIEATLRAARAQEAHRVIAIFQPHRYTRTRDLMGGFAAAFGDADRLIVTEIYAAGDTPIAGVTGLALAEAARVQGHPDVTYHAGLEDVARALPRELRRGDLVLTLGAGDVHRLGEQLLGALREEDAS